MHYYLDGYNLMFRILRATEDFRTLREKIITDLSAKIKILDLNCTLVFDAKYQKGEVDRSRVQSIEILYTAEGETADEFILNELKAEKKPSEHTVVTSDKKLAYLARLCHSHTETVEHFISWLNRRCKNKLKTINRETKKILPVIKPSQQPSQIQLSNIPEECFDYYLQAFEKRLKEQSPKSSMVQREIISDMQRWLRAFEQEK